MILRGFRILGSSKCHDLNVDVSLYITIQMKSSYFLVLFQAFGSDFLKIFRMSGQVQYLEKFQEEITVTWWSYYCPIVIVEAYPFDIHH